MKTKKEISYSYLLRIWVEPNEDDTWRFSLEDTRTGKRHGFTTLENICAYILKITQQDQCSINNDQSGEYREGV
ncbi:MAG: hypothetical protein DRI46_05140 [Chloroflexi bacterium]|nr:MAG: hypothetical protein DRI46_05140 [Chloroflexota bacterium]